MGVGGTFISTFFYNACQDFLDNVAPSPTFKHDATCLSKVIVFNLKYFFFTSEHKVDE